MPSNTLQYHFITDEKTEHRLILKMLSDWSIQLLQPTEKEVGEALDRYSGIRQIAFDTTSLEKWDSSLLVFLRGLASVCKKRGIDVIPAGLPEGAGRLLALAEAVPRKEDARSSVEHKPFLEAVGEDVFHFLDSVGELLEFIGEAFSAVLRTLSGKAGFRSDDIWIFLQDAGARALPIVSLISLLVGLILAFIGLIQLELFGAQIYVADLVSIGMVRMMGAIMTGVIMAGRTGAAYAAQLGTMQVNEEIDALRTLGISPMEFLVMPRMLALTLMMPLLCLYANLMGILGGFIVATSLYGVGAGIYIRRTLESLNWNHLGVGLFLSFIFGILVALAGCLRGMQCGRSASSVGDAATSAVVTGIVAIILATALTTIVCNIIGV